MKEFTKNQIIRFLGKLANKWGTGHESVTKILNNINGFLNKKKNKIKFLDKVCILVEMLEEYSNKKYYIDEGAVGLIIACLAYLVLPTDLIPDFIVGIGFIDDAAAFTLVFKQLDDEIKKFKIWKENTKDLQEAACSIDQQVY